MFSFFDSVIDFFQQLFSFIGVIFTSIITGISFLLHSVPTYITVAGVLPTFITTTALIVLFIGILHFVLSVV